MSKHIAHIQVLIDTYQAHINYMARQIAQIEALIEKAKQARVNATISLTLTNKYQTIYDKYVLYLAKLQELQQKESNRLYRYQAQPD